MEVGTPVEIKPGISPNVFGGGGVLTRDEFNIQPYQTNIANIEQIGYDGNPDLPFGTVMVCHGEKCSIYSIYHLRPYNPEENNINNNNSDPGNVNMLGGKRKLRRGNRTRKKRVQRRNN